MNRRIGLIDYRLDNFHANVYLDCVRGLLSHRGFQVTGATAMVRDPSVAWCQENEVTYVATIEELAATTDFFLILAPSNPETHFELCQQAFPLKQVVFVDKTFAPDLATAKQIFRLARHHGTAVQSTSALRSTAVQEFVAGSTERVVHLSICSSGPSWGEYGIHPLEIAISCFGANVERVRSEIVGQQRHVFLWWKGDRTAAIFFHEGAETPFAATACTKTECRHIVVDGERLFVDAANAILDFLDAGRALIPSAETLAIRQIQDCVAVTNVDVALRPPTLDD